MLIIKDAVTPFCLQWGITLAFKIWTFKISVLDQQDLTVHESKYLLGRGWGWHWISTSSMREINWALWWISAACHFFWEASSVRWTAVVFFNGVTTSSPFTPHCLHPLQNYCDRVNHNDQKHRPIITFPSDCENSNFKTGSPCVVA